jgi:hypothetical protein
MSNRRLAYQPPANSTFLSEQTSHQQPARTSQQYSSLRKNQHQPSATSQPNRLMVCRTQENDLLNYLLQDLYPCANKQCMLHSRLKKVGPFWTWQ